MSDGSRPDKLFKDKDVNLVAKAMKDFCGGSDEPNLGVQSLEEVEAEVG